MIESVAAITSIWPVIPVVAIAEAETAVDLVDALVRGGISIIEVTLRTEVALEAIRRIAQERPDVLVGAGTILTPGDADAALRAGARFLVSPGLTSDLASALSDSPLPVLPGVGTVSEAMFARESGFETLKLFPAEASGGLSFLRSIAGPLPDLSFCPTGGVSAMNAAGFLRLPNVVCVGGSWITPSDIMQRRGWQEIERLAADAVAVRSTPRSASR